MFATSKNMKKPDAFLIPHSQLLPSKINVLISEPKLVRKLNAEATGSRQNRSRRSVFFQSTIPGSDTTSLTKSRSQYSSLIHNAGILDCLKNTCLPKLGIKHFRNMKCSQDDPEAQSLLHKWEQNLERLQNFFRIRLIPPLRSLCQELYFPESQIEADGLTVVCAKIWTATFLIKYELGGLIVEEKDKVLNVFMELIWLAEKGMKINKKFYHCQQSFKKRILPLIWELEDRFSGERKEFVDEDLRENLTVIRQLDGLYLNEDLQKRPSTLYLTTFSKSSNLFSHKEEEITFRDLKSEKKVHIFWNLLRTSLKSIEKVVQGLEAHYRILADQNVLSEVHPIRCSSTFDLNSDYLNSIWKSVQLTEYKKTQMIGRVNVVVDQANSYLTMSQWACDRVAEIAGMIQLCYQFLSLDSQFGWPDYEGVSNQAVGAVSKLDGGKYASLPPSGYNWRNSAKREYQEALDQFLRIQHDKIASCAGAGERSSMTELETTELTQDFMSTEYPWLLKRIPLIVNDDRLYFRHK